MDIQELKKYSNNKIESDDLTKQVRQRIKETAWEKQNQREGFSESFKPLISQFEKPEDPKKKNIFTQNQEMLKNQLALSSGIDKNRLALKYAIEDNKKALSEGLKTNQKAIAEVFNKYRQLEDEGDLLEEDSDVSSLKSEDYNFMKSLYEDQEEDTESEQKKEYYDLNEGYDKFDFDFLEENNFHKPSDLEKKDLGYLKELKKRVNRQIHSFTGKANSLEKKDNLTEKDKENIKNYRNTSDFYSKYGKTIEDVIRLKSYTKQGSGIFFYNSPQKLIKRFELLAGSLAAGNNGVLPEYIQIAHRLRDLGIVTNKQLNTMLRKII